MPQLINFLYTLVLSGLAIYSVYIILLILLYLKNRHKPLPPLPIIAEADLPRVTVQLPFRNEKHVATRIMQAVAKFDWPRDRLEIQLLDDSDDETTAMLAREIIPLQQQGINLQHIRRDHNTGYKAGALAHGLHQTNGEFIAIFDADFCPPPEFLRLMVPYFLTQPKLGMIQSHCDHLNTEYSLLTRAQALLLDAHFSVEHLARNRSGLLMNFNGTGGIWRRATIEQSGGWSSDTVAEDLDLSYRAQLNGWHLLYLPHVTVYAELPPLAMAFKNQQYRWAKGAAQTLRKLAWPILTSPHLTPAQKIMAFFHLGGYFNLVMLLMMIFLMLPMVIYNPNLSQLAAFLGSLAMIPPVMYILGQAHWHTDWPRRALYYPMLMLIGVGLSWSVTLALIDGFTHWGGSFIRTPKFSLTGRSGEWRQSSYRMGLNATLLGEIIIGLYALASLGLALYYHHNQLLPFIIIAVIGQALMIGWTVQQSRN